MGKEPYSDATSALRMLLALMILAVLAGMTGCDIGAAQSPPQSPPDAGVKFTRYHVARTFTAYEFHLEDGTRCVQAGDGVDCEWKVQ
jgi:hypothetical protein